MMKKSKANKAKELADNLKDKKALLEAALPSHVFIMGHKIPVIVRRLTDAQGEFCLETRTIRISLKHDVDKVHLTLFHESVHAALYLSGQAELLSEKHEEAIVLLMENAFAGWIAKDILRYKG